MTQHNPTDRQALEAIIARATVDRSFRQQLITDPRRAIQQAFGLVIPPEFRIRFIERDPDLDALVVLPDFRAENDELSDTELEAVLGGHVAHHAAWSDAGGGTHGVADGTRAHRAPHDSHGHSEGGGHHGHE
ncbi:MAG TPA: NHLP leader peptide family RiPP precursor [Gemmatimonadaceae bacterium]|nr:NHLP leader peptide family RiPP precursor [Gemmatimonadaceae bacterium]